MIVRSKIAIVVSLFVAAGCGSEPERAQTVATPRPIIAAAINSAALSATDMGAGWTATANAALNTVQIGGKIGATNIAEPPAQATTAFTQKTGSGFVSNSVFLMGTPALARSVIDAHERAATTTSWTQTRREGGRTEWRVAGALTGLDPPLGDGMFATKLRASITDPRGAKTGRTVEYIVYRVGRIVAFVVAQDTPAAPHARKQEAKVKRAAGG